MIIPSIIDTTISSSLSYVYSFKPYAEATVIIPASLNVYIDQTLLPSLPISLDLASFLFLSGFLLVYPLGLLLSLIPSQYTRSRHFFSFLSGALILQYVNNLQWTLLLLPTLLSFLLFHILPPRFIPYIVPPLAVAYTVLGHLHRQYTNYLGYDLDFTGGMMVLCIKLYSLSFNISDGADIKLYGTGTGDGASKAALKCCKYAVSKPPSLLEHLGYCFCFSTVLAGPSFEHIDYMNAITCSNRIDITTGKQLGPPPSRFNAVMLPTVTSLVCCVVHVLGNLYVPWMNTTNPQLYAPMVLIGPYSLTPIDGTPVKALYIRFAYQYVSFLCVRMKYFVAWKLAEGGSNTWYAGFEGFTTTSIKGNDKVEEKGWNISSNVEIIPCELPVNCQTGSQKWNIKTGAWLNRYIYIRTKGSLVCTYGMSAFWHGFYPGYYLLFLSMPMLTSCERAGKRKITPYFYATSTSASTSANKRPISIPTSTPTKGYISYLYHAVCVIVTEAGMTYLGGPFMSLSFEWGVEGWRQNYYAGHFCMVAFLVVTFFMPKVKVDGVVGGRKKMDKVE